MLINENKFKRGGIVVVMNDLAIIVALVKGIFLEIAKQELALGTGLQNAAPGDKTGQPNKSVQYLLDGADALTKLAEQCDELSPTSLSSPHSEV
jgi:hypothetical protein